MTFCRVEKLGADRLEVCVMAELKKAQNDDIKAFHCEIMWRIWRLYTVYVFSNRRRLISTINYFITNLSVRPMFLCSIVCHISQVLTSVSGYIFMYIFSLIEPLAVINQ